MTDQVPTIGWQQLNSDTANDYLYKSFPAKNLTSGLQLVNAAAGLAVRQQLDKTTHLSVDGYAVTISLNSPADAPLSAAHFVLANMIDNLSLN